MVHHREGELRAAHFASRRFQAGECLRGSAFMDQMAVDIDERRLAGLFVDDVRVPDFFVQRTRGHRPDYSIPRLYCSNSAEVPPIEAPRLQQGTISIL